MSEIPLISVLLHLAAATAFGVIGWRQSCGHRRVLWFAAAGLFVVAAILQLVSQSGM